MPVNMVAPHALEMFALAKCKRFDMVALVNPLGGGSLQTTNFLPVATAAWQA
jgi:hypothetical protein